MIQTIKQTLIATSNVLLQSYAMFTLYKKQSPSLHRIRLSLEVGCP